MINLIEQAKKDILAITSNASSGFGQSITITTPDGLVSTNINGLSTKHHIGIDSDGSLMNVKNAHISFSEALLTDVSYPVRNINGEVQLRGHKITTKDSTGVDKNYIITENFPDETIGMIVCILGDYADNPSEENQPSYLWNCADASVINSDSTFTYNIPSGETYILPDITHVDSNGTDVVKAAQTPMVCTPNQALNISNSNDSFDVNTLVDLELPNINFTDSNGVTTSIPSMEAITASSCVAKSGLAYHRPLTTGARISYKTKDDYWQIINNDYSDAPAHPLHFVKLQAGTFDMLVDDNTFGNKNKNTDKLGGQVYTDDYCVDNLTGIGWKTTLQTAESWDDAMNTVAALSHAGFDDYYIPNQREQNTLLDYGLDNIRMINYSPFNITLNNYIWTSTTRRDASHFAHAIVPYIHSEGTRPKTSTYQYLVCRKHF